MLAAIVPRGRASAVDVSDVGFVAAMFLDHYGTPAEGDRQLWRANAHGWHLYPVPLPRPADDCRT